MPEHPCTLTHAGFYQDLGLLLSGCASRSLIALPLLGKPTQNNCYLLMPPDTLILLYYPAILQQNSVQSLLDSLYFVEGGKDAVGICVSHSTSNFPPTEELGKRLEDA